MNTSLLKHNHILKQRDSLPLNAARGAGGSEFRKSPSVVQGQSSGRRSHSMPASPTQAEKLPSRPGFERDRHRPVSKADIVAYTVAYSVLYPNETGGGVSNYLFLANACGENFKWRIISESHI